MLSAKKVESLHEDFVLEEAERAPGDKVARTPFAALAAGRPLLDHFSTRYLREVGMYIYEAASGEVHAAIANEQQLPLVNAVAWTLQRKVHPEFVTEEDIAAMFNRVVGKS